MARLARMTAAARVHRRDELHLGGKGHMGIGARDVDLASLKRLAQP